MTIKCAHIWVASGHISRKCHNFDLFTHALGTCVEMQMDKQSHHSLNILYMLCLQWMRMFFLIRHHFTFPHTQRVMRKVLATVRQIGHWQKRVFYAFRRTEKWWSCFMRYGSRSKSSSYSREIIHFSCCTVELITCYFGTEEFSFRDRKTNKNHNQLNIGNFAFSTPHFNAIRRIRFW